MLALVRICVLFVYFILINIVLVLVCVLRPFHRNNVYVAGKLYSSMTYFMGLKLDLRVPSSVKNGGPFVFIANHQNSYDLITICSAAQQGTVTVGKKSLKWIPLFGQVYWLSGNIMIDRENSGKARDTLKAAAHKIHHRKLSVWFFPEGTRSYGRGLLPFKSGAFRLAKVANTPVVTIAASNLHNKIKLNRWNNGTLLIDISEPQLMDSSRSTKGWIEYFHQQMSEQIEKLDLELAQQ